MLKSGPEMPYPQDYSCATRGRGIKYPIATFVAVTARLLSRCWKVVRQICRGLVLFNSLALGHCVPVLVEWSLESLTGQCYGLCAPNPSTKARVRSSGAPSYDCFCRWRKPLLGSWPAQALIDGRNTTSHFGWYTSNWYWRAREFVLFRAAYCEY